MGSFNKCYKYSYNYFDHHSQNLTEDMESEDKSFSLEILLHLQERSAFCLWNQKVEEKVG